MPHIETSFIKNSKISGHGDTLKSSMRDFFNAMASEYTSLNSKESLTENESKLLEEIHEWLETVGYKLFTYLSKEDPK